MKAWMVRYLSSESVEFCRLFQEKEDALIFSQNLPQGSFPLDPEPTEISPEDFLAYQLQLKTSLF